MKYIYKYSVKENNFISEALQLVEELTNIVNSYIVLVPEKYEPSITEHYLEVPGFLKEFNFKVNSLDLTIEKFVYHPPFCSNRLCPSLTIKEEDRNDFENIHKQTIELKNIMNNKLLDVVDDFTNKSKLYIKNSWKSIL